MNRMIISIFGERVELLDGFLQFIPHLAVAPFPLSKDLFHDHGRDEDGLLQVSLKGPVSTEKP